MGIGYRFGRLAAAVSLCACAGIASAQTSTTPPPGQLLASNCFQCHGTNGNPQVAGFDRLAGMAPDELFKKLKEFQANTDPNEIMDVHARGYTDAQIRLIADFFSRQPR